MKKILCFVTVFAVVLGCSSCISRKAPMRNYVLLDVLSATPLVESSKCQRCVISVTFPKYIQKQRHFVVYDRHTGEVRNIPGGTWQYAPELMIEDAVTSVAQRKGYVKVSVSVRNFYADTDGVFRFSGCCVCKDGSGKEVFNKPFDYSVKLAAGIPTSAEYINAANASVRQFLELLGK